MTYQLTTKNIKSITLRVDKNGVVKVSAPRRVSRAQIDNFVARHQEWIARKIENTPKYANGAIVKYFDESYILQINFGAKNSVREAQNLFGEKVLEIILKADSATYAMGAESSVKGADSAIKALITKWYKQKSQNLLCQIAQSYKSTINREVRRISLREMTTKWGSCNYRTATISLNIALFRKPQICIEYVLLHELVHLIHPNHGAGFYAMLGELMPNWREVKDLLKR